MNVAEQFGRNLARVRREAGMGQDDLAVGASVHRTEISQLERAMRVPRIDTLVKLASVLEVDPGELLKGIKWQPTVVRQGKFAESI